jgi:hypothetical protein
MSCGVSTNRPVLTLSRAVALLIAVLLSVATSKASASILQLEFATDPGEIITQIEISSSGTGAATSSPSSSNSERTGWPVEQSQADELEALNLAASTSGGSTSSSSSSPVAGAASASALLEVAADMPADMSNAHRVAFERTLFLPDAPGNELLRPPRVG